MNTMSIKLTNKLGLPEPIVEAMKNDPYDSGRCDYSITGLLKPPRMLAITSSTTIVEDAMDKLFSLQGQIMHMILERAGKALAAEGYVVEKRFRKSYVIDSKITTVSAQIDLFDPVTATLYDYKYTSVSAAKHGLKEEHKLQLNFQAEMLRKEGFKVEKAEVILLFRDWSAERDYPGYPEVPFLKQTVPLMSSEEVTTWVVGRIKAHEAAKVQLPLCTDEERWSRPTFAVMKDLKSAKATRVFDSRKDAEDHITAKASTSVIVERAGISRRCLRYCPARFVCEQAKELTPAPILDEDGLTKIT